MTSTKPNRFLVIQCHNLTYSQVRHIAVTLDKKGYKTAQGSFLGRIVVGVNSEYEETLLRLQLGNISAEGFDSFKDLMEWNSELYLGS